VSFNGASYISLVAGNTGNQPDATPTMWNPLADIGARGLQGPEGPLGIQGVPGLTGLQGPVGPSGPVGSQVLKVYDANNLLVGDIIGTNGYEAWVWVERNGHSFMLRVILNHLLSSSQGPYFASPDCTGPPSYYNSRPMFFPQPVVL
jgi:hypothetical protein